MSEGPNPKKGLSLKGIKAKITVVPKGQLSTEAPPAVNEPMPSGEKVVAEDKAPVRPIATAARGTRLFFQKNQKKAGVAPGSLAGPKVLPAATKVVPPPKKVEAPPPPPPKPVEKKATVAVAPPKPKQDKALKAIKAVFDQLKEDLGVDSYDEIDFDDFKDETLEENGRTKFFFMNPINEDFTELNEQFTLMEFTPGGILATVDDEDAFELEKLQLFELFDDVIDEKEEEEEEAPKPKTGTPLNAVLADETLGELAEPILKEEGRLPGETLEEKLADKYAVPKPEEGYRPTNRRNFGNFITQTFKPFELPPLPAIDLNACKSVLEADRSEMYLYQQFVKEYMSWQTPYRGILVYHGLGSGKTCTSIAAAEALFATSDRKIIVMTPFSLRPNFIGEITTCGFHHFRLKNHWTAYPKSNPLIIAFAKNVLSIPESYLATASRVWIPDFSKPENFSTLKAAEQAEVRNQITNTIVFDPKQKLDGRIWFVNYNGITKKELLRIACQRPTAFDNAVIIVDEIHNLIRVMQGTVEPYLVELGKKMKRKIDFEPVGFETWKPKMCPADWSAFESDKEAQRKIYKRGYLFYRLLTQAKNTKIIGLSGTPLINFPEELGILANILHGYLQIVIGDVQKTPTSDSASIAKDTEIMTKLKTLLSKHPYIDFYDVSKKDTSIQFRITFLPEGIRNIPEKTGVERIPPTENAVTFAQRLAALSETLVANGIKIIPATKDMSFRIDTQPLLPPIGNEFANTFLEKDMIKVKNDLVLMKRLTGLVSFYKGSRKDLMPTVRKDETVLVPMSLFQQKKYSEVRLEEISIEEKKEEKKKKEGVTEEAGGKLSQLFAEVYEIKNMPQSSNYRMGSRQACNFVFPSEVHRPKPRTKAEKETEVGQDKDDILDATAGDAEGLGTDVEKEKAAEEAVENEIEDEKEPEEEEEEGEEEEEEEELFDEAYERQEAINAGFTEEEVEAYVESKREEFEQEQAAKKAAKTAAKKAKATVTGAQQRCRAVRLPGEKYQDQINRAKECLATTAKSKLMMLSTGLGETSPKYMKMMENIAAAPGSSLVYSQFLQMEGIGIFALAMEANGYEPIEISFSWQNKQAFFSKRTKESLAKGPSPDPVSAIKQLRYIKFTGGEENEVRKYSLLLFNGLFDQLPAEMSKVLRDAGWTGNDRGDLCRVFCITSAGAEGLSLKNVRAVHIMEPYWNDVRMAQVKGRAVRICSHAELEPEERTVDVFTYVSVFSPASQKARDGDLRIAEKIVNRDSLTAAEATEAGLPLPAGAMQYTLTSDQRLWLISNRKKALINNLQTIMKRAAVDCELNYEENKDGTFKCMTFLNAKVGDFMYDPDFATDIEKTALLKVTKAPAATAVAGPKATVAAPKAAVAAKAVEAKPKGKITQGKIGDTSYFFEAVTDAEGKTTKFFVYAATDKDYKTVIGEIQAMESKKSPGTFVPKASTLTLF
jgi:hypothetical protein